MKVDVGKKYCVRKFCVMENHKDKSLALSINNDVLVSAGFSD